MLQNKFSYVWQLCHELEQSNITICNTLSEIKQEMFDPNYQKKYDIIINYGESQKVIRTIEKILTEFHYPIKLSLYQKAIIEAMYAIKIWDKKLCRYVRKYTTEIKS